MKRTLFTLIIAAVGSLCTTACDDEPIERPDDTLPVAVESVTLNKTTVELSIGSSLTLEHTVRPVDATEKAVTWRSTDEHVATVDNGTVTALNEGVTTVVVTTKDGGRTAGCIITVVPHEVESVVVSPNAATLTPGDELALQATVYPLDATNRTVTWSSDSPAVTVDADGMVTAVSGGVAIVTATTEDGGKTAFSQITVLNLNLGTVSFASDKTWTVGAQVWSDVVMAAGCDKTDYDGGTLDGGYKADCRRNPGYGDMFSYEAANLYAAELCPAPWRVPTIDDFVTLDMTLNDREDAGGRTGDQASLDNYLDPELWNAKYGGYAIANSILGQGDYAYYTSSSQNAMGIALQLHLARYQKAVYPQYGSIKSYGFMLRCVR